MLKKCLGKLAAFVLSASVMASAQADVDIIDSTTFIDVQKIVATKQKEYGIDQVLLVFDIDNTLLTGEEDLGSDVWYQWQTGVYPELSPTGDDALKGQCLLNAIGLLYELSPMKPTEPQVPDMLQDWAARGFTIMALTSRGPAFRAATERELSLATSSKGQSLLTTLSSHALAPLGEPTPTYRFPVISKGKSRQSDNAKAIQREMSYMNGVMMTSGMHKGSMLEVILQKTNRHFNAIIFVDDTRKNVDRLKESFDKRENIDLSVVYYTHIEEQRKHENEQETGEAVVLSTKQADMMAAQWKTLNRTLHELYPTRVERDKNCQ